MQPAQTSQRTLSPQMGLALAGLLGLAVAGGLAGYARVSPGHGAALFTLGFTGMLPMKAWLTTIATVLVLVQIASALGMWGKLPGVSADSKVLAPLHRWTGTVAFVVSLPVAFHCVWSLGFSTFDTRTLVHSLVGCLFYGVFAAKMLSLRLKGLPGWVLPVLGGVLSALLVTLWFTAAFWYFTNPSLSVY